MAQPLPGEASPAATATRDAGPAPAAPPPSSAAGRAVEDRIRAAEKAAEAEAANLAQASARRLAELMRGRPDARFAALAETESVLTPNDRAALLRSLRDGPIPSRPVPAATASRVAIWRSRLPYRVVPLGVAGLGGIAVAVFGGIAWHRTPERWVGLAGDRPLEVAWRLPEGGQLAGGLNPGRRYALLRREGEVGVLRSWLAGRGYAEARVPMRDLKDLL